MGFYSNKSRGLRKKAGLSLEEIEILEEEAKQARSQNYAWARLIKKVYEVSALTCKRCGGEMRVISVITDHETIKQILKHLGRWNIRCHSPPPFSNIHPPPDIDSSGDVEKQSQDFIPSDDHNLTRTVKLDGCFLAARRVEARTAEINTC